jgi:hypothetical protein
MLVDPEVSLSAKANPFSLTLHVNGGLEPLILIIVLPPGSVFSGLSGSHLRYQPGGCCTSPGPVGNMHIDSAMTPFRLIRNKNDATKRQNIVFFLIGFIPSP